MTARRQRRALPAVASGLALLAVLTASLAGCQPSHSADGKRLIYDVKEAPAQTFEERKAEIEKAPINEYQKKQAIELLKKQFEKQ